MRTVFWVRFLCSFFPPVLAQQLRSKLISIRAAEELALPFKRRSFTGSYLKGNTADFHAFKFLIHGYFDWRNVVLAKKIARLKKGDIIEVGANIGTETIGLADINPNGRVYAFEPLPSNFESLKAIKDVNDLQNLELYDVLVSDKKGEAFFKIPAKNSSGSGHIASEENETTQRFEVVTLDETLETNRAVSSIIADVEGYEPQVLAGAKEVLERSKPFLILEVNERFLRERAQTNVAQFYDSLVQQGYNCYYIERLGISKVDPKEFKTKSNKNWLCIPNEYIDKKGALGRTIALNAWNPFLRFFVF